MGEASTQASADTVIIQASRPQFVWSQYVGERSPTWIQPGSTHCYCTSKTLILKLNGQLNIPAQFLILSM